jgi:hypothetical protein
MREKREVFILKSVYIKIMYRKPKVILYILGNTITTLEGELIKYMKFDVSRFL